jgi:hypothetical protein
MENTVYCVVDTEPQANVILTHLRNIGFKSSEISVLLKEKDTRNISIRENAIHGAEAGGALGGALGGLLGFTAMSIPAIGALMVAGPIIAALGGAAVGGAVGGLAGGSGAFARFGIPHEVQQRLQDRILDGGILIAVHSDNPLRRDRAQRVFKSSGAEEVCSSEDLAA